MGHKQIVQLQDHAGNVIAEVELPAIFPTPRVIVLDGIAYERVVDLLVFRAIPYFWVGNEVNQQRLVDKTGELVWQQTIH